MTKDDSKNDDGGAGTFGSTKLRLIFAAAKPGRLALPHSDEAKSKPLASCVRHQCEGIAT